jgi:hypothetical protein
VRVEATVRSITRSVDHFTYQVSHPCLHHHLNPQTQPPEHHFTTHTLNPELWNLNSTPWTYTPKLCNLNPIQPKP